MAVSFNGTTDVYGSTGNPTVLDIPNNNPMSLMCWVNLATVTPAQQGGIVTKGYDGTNGAYSFSITLGPPTLNWGSFNNSTGSHGVTADVSAVLHWNAGDWHHIYGDYTGSGTHIWNLYVDGILNNSSNDVVGPISTVERFAVGANDVSGGFLQFFQGCVADVAVFNGPLTGTEILQLGNGSLRPPGVTSKTLLGYYPLDSGGTTTQADSSVNGNTLTKDTSTPTTCASSPVVGVTFSLMGQICA